MRDDSPLADLIALVREVAPRTAAGLRPPAPAAELDAAEAASGVSWPVALRELYETVDGEGDTAGGDGSADGSITPEPLLSLAALSQTQESLAAPSRVAEPDEAGTSTPHYDRRLIPFAGTDDDLLVVDLREGEHSGAVLQWWDGLHGVDEVSEGAQHYPDLDAYFALAAHSVRTGEPLYIWRPVIADGRLEWELVDDDDIDADGRAIG